MDYAKHYGLLIDRARYRPNPVGLIHRHHVIPRCMGGTDVPSNLVGLTPEEHFVAHQLLTKMYPASHGLKAAVVCMAKGCSGRRVFGWLRRRIAEAASLTHKGRKKSPEHLAAISRALTGRKLSPEHAEKMRRRRRSPEGRALSAEKQRGQKYSEESKAKMSAAKLGRPLSEEVREKISAGLRALGRHCSPETKAKISAKAMGNLRNLGRKHTPESIAKMSAIHRARWANRRA